MSAGAVAAVISRADHFRKDGCIRRLDHERRAEKIHDLAPVAGYTHRHE
jgi:hypothetical protein